jgi:magnesium-transporting ATPase (P-type)
VLAIATKPVAEASVADIENELGGLTLLGLVGFIDPLRPEAAKAVADCQYAGIAVKMITGDHPATALAIARQLGLGSSADEVVTGEDLRRAGSGDQAVLARITHASVFARVEPSQKVAIITLLKRGGHFIAMTGDGVNDAPALRQADIGVAMGLRGTDVARDAADLVITDDNFASIVGGVEEGRAAYANIRKVVFLLVSTGLAEALIFLLALVTGLPYPLGAAQLLWLNLVTNGGQDVALAFEKPDQDLLTRPPRRPSEPIFDTLMIRQVVVSAAYIAGAGFAVFAWALAQGYTEAEARNLLLFLMVLFENVQALNARSETRSIFQVPLRDNMILVVAVVVAQSLHIAAPFIPVVRDVLGVPISPQMWVLLLGIAVSLMVVTEAERALRRRSCHEGGAVSAAG